MDYDFRNDANENIATEVAFPIPPYDLSMDEILPAQQAFDDFRLWVNNSPVQYQTQARSFVKGRDLTLLLEGMHVDVSSFGHAKSNTESPDIQRLTNSQRKQLEQAGLIDSDGSPNWEVHKKYYWRQIFPAHSTIHIRHVYTPVLGSLNSIKYGLGPAPDLSSARELGKFCIDRRLDTVLRQVALSTKKDAPYSYVDFILTSANTWKRPIEDFTLIVERPHQEGDLADYVSFCWDGPVTKIDTDHFSAKATNFVPKRELKIGFFGITKARF